MQCDTFADIYLELLACSHGRQLLVMKMGQPSSHFKFFYVLGPMDTGSSQFLVPSVLEYLKLLESIAIMACSASWKSVCRFKSSFCNHSTILHHLQKFTHNIFSALSDVMWHHSLIDVTFFTVTGVESG